MLSLDSPGPLKMLPLEQRCPGPTAQGAIDLSKFLTWHFVIDSEGEGYTVLTLTSAFLRRVEPRKTRRVGGGGRMQPQGGGGPRNLPHPN